MPTTTAPCSTCAPRKTTATATSPARKNFPLAELHDQLSKIRAAKDRPLIIYDNDGLSAAAAAKTLRDGGFEDIYILDGGLNSWIAENLPVVSK